MTWRPEGGKILDISEKFVDHEADFSTEADDAMMQALREKAEQYQTAFLHRREEDREAESVARHITAAMNELALYCMAGSDEERLNYVISPAATRPKMAALGKYAITRITCPMNRERAPRTATCSRFPC